MFSVGEKIIYGENGVCTVESIAPLSGSTDGDKLYYHLRPLIGSGKYFAPVDSGAFMRPVMSRDEAEALIDAIPDIEPAICADTRSAVYIPLRSSSSLFSMRRRMCHSAGEVWKQARKRR